MERFLALELESLGCSGCEIVSGGVLYKGSLPSAMNLCLWSRQANKVLLLLAQGYVKNEAGVYDLGKKIDFSRWLNVDYTFCVRTHLNDNHFKNSHFLSLKLKDAIVDQMREKSGMRPNVDTENPDVAFSLQIISGRARIFIELQGDSLNRRGYRRKHLEAPLRESLAASMLAFSGWDNAPLMDPMCGSGTIAIEAALKASCTAPGIQRKFGFERWPIFPTFADEWQKMRTDARAMRRPVDFPIIASDIDPEAIETARRNAQTAGVDQYIQFKVCDVLDTQPFAQGGTVIMNPPYGERLDAGDPELCELYYQMGRHFRNFKGHTLTILSFAELLKKKLHLKPDERIKVFNGPLECEVARYDIF